MAVAHETATESHAGTTGSASEASFDISVPFTADSKGLLVFTFVNLNADDALSVKIDPAGANTDVPAVSGGRAVDTDAETGDCKAWFLGSGLPTTTTTVRINRTNNANDMYAVAITVTASGETEVHTPGIVLLQENATITEQSVDDGSPGTNSLRYAGVNSGLGIIPTIGANSTGLQSIDFGARVAATVRETTAGQGSRSVGWTFTSTPDDRAAVHLAVREVAGGTAHSATQTDPEGLLDTSSVVAEYNRSQDDPLNLTDTADRQSDQARSQDEALGLTDSADIQADAVRPLTDPLGLTDTATGESAAERSHADPLGLVDDVTYDLTAGGTAHTATITDSLGMVDDAVTARNIVIAATDPLGLTDTAATATDFEQIIIDLLGLTDPRIQEGAIDRAVTDPLGLVDAIAFTAGVPFFWRKNKVGFTRNPVGFRKIGPTDDPPWN